MPCSIPAIVFPIPGRPDSYTDTFGKDSDYLINPHEYVKLDEVGNELPDDAPEWAMVRDNTTGLTWEVKNSLDGVADYTNHHDADNIYTWYDPNLLSNGGYSGEAGNETDTEDVIAAMNAAAYGGFDDWRLPSIVEIAGLANASPYTPSIDTNYFPNTMAFHYWSASVLSYDSNYAYSVDFYWDNILSLYKGNERCVRGRSRWISTAGGISDR